MKKAIKLRLCKENVITTSSMNQSSVNLGCVDVIVVVVVVVSHVENAIILVDSKCLFIRHIPFPTKITVDHQIELSGVIP